MFKWRVSFILITEQRVSYYWEWKYHDTNEESCSTVKPHWPGIQNYVCELALTSKYPLIESVTASRVLPKLQIHLIWELTDLRYLLGSLLMIGSYLVDIPELHYTPFVLHFKRVNNLSGTLMSWNYRELLHNSCCLELDRLISTCKCRFMMYAFLSEFFTNCSVNQQMFKLESVGIIINTPAPVGLEIKLLEINIPNP